MIVESRPEQQHRLGPHLRGQRALLRRRLAPARAARPDAGPGPGRLRRVPGARHHQHDPAQGVAVLDRLPGQPGGVAPAGERSRPHRFGRREHVHGERLHRPQSVTGGSRDSLNVEEGVRVPMPGAGLWTVRVAAKAVPIGPQPFALVVTGGLGAGAGTLAMDRTQYGSSGTVQLQVTDPGRHRPAHGDGRLGHREHARERHAHRRRTACSTARSRSSNLLPAADGDLSVSNGDLITASYVDATYSATLTTQATVGIDPPIITNVRATSQGVAGTLVSWTTDRNADSRVYWGATPALELGAVTRPDFAFAHAVLLTGLTPGQTYYYDVESVGLTGGSVRDDFGGAHRRFTAKGQGDILLLLGAADFSRLVHLDRGAGRARLRLRRLERRDRRRGHRGQPGRRPALVQGGAVAGRATNTYPGFSDSQRALDRLAAGRRRAPDGDRPRHRLGPGGSDVARLQRGACGVGAVVAARALQARSHVLRSHRRLRGRPGLGPVHDGTELRGVGRERAVG